MSDRLEEIKKDWDYERDRNKTVVSSWKEKSTIYWLIQEIERLQKERDELKIMGRKK